MDRERRYYSLTVVPEAPGGIHHPTCPCCLERSRVEQACRSAYGMRKAGLSDRTILRELGYEGANGYQAAVAFQFVNGALPASLRNYWNGP